MIFLSVRGEISLKKDVSGMPKRKSILFDFRELCNWLTVSQDKGNLIDESWR